jgi:hypothetical protein
MLKGSSLLLIYRATSTNQTKPPFDLVTNLAVIEIDRCPTTTIMGTAVVLGPAAAVAGAGALVAEVAGVGGAGIAVTSVAAGKSYHIRPLFASILLFHDIRLSNAWILGAGPMATAALTAQGMAMAAVGAGPLGWVILGGAVMSGIVIAAGEADMVRPCCWETVIRPDEMNSTNFELQREHGMLLPHLASYCEMFKADDDEKLVLRNSDGE